ncbi:katanin p80 WD40 repeat-containing subunit B1 isoform X1 [Acyrthosiphon pisum]|uniref:Katanin p80 WD40 repeat-containing subunit B1 n=1 Tax=Acyrthosiphon pisum TaxID=7029 RepID=A0A8R2FD27_ACYPI|nr:katanin p80 WD40 repeat-containing subunit B1 isoform X1 [Acyrthosiphon pisum]|eukprot:XP_008187002.1 PREDICTED: katanin p80 WD40 repeat-containing subunit B1 isoform X1 [Acyrthosiphon pisum]
MANPNKHICKLQEFSAHNANVTCLALGQKSGLVLATGGADNKVNLWKVDSETCFMSLCGHVTPIECVQFDPSEYLVGAGSQTGGLKVWDLTKGKKVKTFSGHKSAVTKLDFFPFASSSYFVTGSKDTNVKLWDYRYSHCIGMYKGHEASISSLKYSPDGLWIASGDEDGCVKIWDLRVGRMIHVFNKLHNGTVTSIQFHPLVFLLASSGTDKKINILDLERFSIISQIDTEKSIIRCLQFNDKGDVLYGGGDDYLGVYGVEPTRVCDSVVVKWGNMNELVVKDNRIVGASHLSTDVSTWLINLPEEYPFKNQFSPPDKSSKPNTMFTRDTSVRKSFNKQKSREMIKPKTNMKLIDESETDIDDENQTVINNVHDYHSVFKPNRTSFKPSRILNRSPPPFSPLSEDDNPNDIFIPEVNRNQSAKLEEKKHSIDHSQGLMQSSYSEAETSSVDSTPCDSFQLPQFESSGDYHTPDLPTPLSTPESIEVSEKRHNPYITSSVSMRSVSSNVINESLSKRPSSLPVFRQNDHFAYGNKYTSPQSQRKIIPDEITSLPHHKRLLADDYLVTPEHKKTDIIAKKFELPLDDFGELKNVCTNSLNNVMYDEEEIVEILSKNHKSTMGVLKERQRYLNIIQTLWTNKNFKCAVNSAVSMNDDAVISDLISIITQRPNLWCLDVCSMLLPSISDLIQSGNEAFINVSFKAIRDILQYFMPVIKNNIQRPPSAIGVDIMQEERYNKCRKCQNILMDIRSFVLKRQTVQGNLGNVFRQLHMLLQTIDI